MLQKLLAVLRSIQSFTPNRFRHNRLVVVLSLLDETREIALCEFAVAHAVQIDLLLALSVRHHQNLHAFNASTMRYFDCGNVADVVLVFAFFHIADLADQIDLLVSDGFAVQDEPVPNDFIEKHVGKIGEKLRTREAERFHVFKVDTIRDIALLGSWLFLWGCFFSFIAIVARFQFTTRHMSFANLLIDKAVFPIRVVVDILYFFCLVARSSFRSLRLVSDSTLNKPSEKYSSSYISASSFVSVCRFARLCIKPLHLLQTSFYSANAPVPHPFLELCYIH